MLPVRNGKDHVAAAIESILDQTFDDFELLVVDDGSTDSTARIVRRLGRADERLRIVHLPPSGQPRAMNQGVALARGDLIARMDADDISLPDRLERQVRFLDEHPEVVVLGTQYELFGEKNRKADQVLHPTDPGRIRRVLRRHHCAICHPSAVFRRSVFLEVGGYRPYFAPAEDFELWLRMSEAGELANLPEILLRYRFHVGSLSSQRCREQRFSVYSALHLWREASEPRPDLDGSPGTHSRSRLLELGLSPSEVDAAESSVLILQVPLLARFGHPKLALQLLRTCCAEMTSPESILRAQWRAARDLLTGARRRAANAAFHLPPGVAAESPLAQRLLRLAAAFRKEARRPLRATVLSGLGRRVPSPRSARARLLERLGRIGWRSSPEPAPEEIGFFDHFELLEDHQRAVLHGWGRMPGGRAGYSIEISSPCPARVLRTERVPRADVADVVGEDLLFSGFEISVQFEGETPPDPDELALWIVAANGSKERLRRYVPAGDPSAKRRGERTASVPPRRFSGDLRRLSDRRPPTLGTFDVAGYMVVRNEVELLHSALDHQRRLGVKHFFVVDNDSSDGTTDLLIAETDVTAFRNEASFQESNFGMQWMAALLDEYGLDRWVALLDADEAFVYPRFETLSLGDLARFLTRAPYDAVNAVCIDMYPPGALADARPKLGTPLLEICPYLDSRGYDFFAHGSQDLWVRGGPRARLFWPEYVEDRARRLQAARASWNEAAYLEDHPDVRALLAPAGTFASGFEHFVQRGRFESRAIRPQPHPSWLEDDYRRQNPDVDRAVVAGAFPSGLDHFLRHGQFEDRSRFEPPPLLSLTPFLRWNRDLRFGVSRHNLGSDRTLRLAPIRAGVLHFKLLGRLAARSEVEVQRQEHWNEAVEYRRYAEVLRAEPRLSAYSEISVRFQGSRQLQALGLLATCDALERFADQRTIAHRLAVPGPVAAPI